MKKQKAISSALLVLTASIWGVAFVAQSVGMDYLEPLTFNFIRFLIGGVVLIPFLLWKEKSTKEHIPIEEKKQKQKYTILGGLSCGVVICFASLLQQYGIQRTTVGKAGFITSLYIIIVPILGIFLKKKVKLIIWVSTVIAVIGFYLMCLEGELSLGVGDFLVLLCAIVFAIHILVIDYFSPKGDAVKISCIQFIVSAVICGIGAFLLETPTWANIIACKIPLLYAGVLSCGVAYTLQIVGQKNMDPTVASLILSLESVISAIAGFLILKQSMSMKEMIGCCFVFLAIILAQLPDKKRLTSPV